jgi:hypothetical protein
VRGEAQLEAIKTVLEVFAENRDELVIIGGCALPVFARPQGGPLRTTDDVDCLSTVLPWTRQQQVLARLCTEGRLVPDLQRQFRYGVAGTNLLVDILSPEGLNIGGGNKWLREAAANARVHTIGETRFRCVTPPYFLLLKLEAVIDRGPDLLSSKDLEDVVYVAVEVDDLVAQVEAAGLAVPVAETWGRVFSKHQISAESLPEIVAAHIHRDDGGREDAALRTLVDLARSGPR